MAVLLEGLLVEEVEEPMLGVMALDMVGELSKLDFGHQLYDNENLHGSNVTYIYR